jgi:GH24 family phage-related lysozyme (muramidase)
MSDTETTEDVDLEETPDPEALEGSNAKADPPEDGKEAEPEPEGEELTDEEAEARGFSIGRLSKPGAGFIARFEGCVLRMYNDPTRNATIGVGHLIHLGPINGREPPEFKRGITRQRALELLMGDAGKAGQSVRQMVKVPLNQQQLDALISFTFNCGAGSLSVSTLRARLNRGDYAAVPHELNKWVFSSGKRLPGLVRRRQAEGVLFSHGKYV